MVVRIGENSARIIARRTITQDLIPAPHVDVVSGRPMMYCGHKQITADGYVTLNGETGDDASEWTAGFIQIEVSERNQAIYRGLHQGARGGGASSLGGVHAVTGQNPPDAPVFPAQARSEVRRSEASGSLRLPLSEMIPAAAVEGH